MRLIDLSSWQGLLVTVGALVLITLIGVGIRLLVMQTLQARRQRENRQINERLRTLIAAYKVLGGSFTGNLSVDPSHLRELRLQAAAAAEVDADVPADEVESALEAALSPGGERRRRIRDAVEAALSDILLLGTEEQVRLAAQAAADLAAGRPVQTDALVVSLRDFIREVLDLEPIPAGLAVPRQGPTRPGSTGRSGGGREGGRGGGQGGGQGGGMGGGASAGGVAMGMGGAAGSRSLDLP
ncbi:MAG: hypothetical protein MEQ07_06200 [Aquimonas sp.]|nr:hypothetical protein [Aquimonas sp.]